MADQFDIKKLVTSPFTGVYWVKVVMFGLGIGCLAFIGYGVYKAYFKKPLPTTTQQGQRDNFNYVLEPRSYFGCQNFRLLKEGIKPEVKK